MSTGVTVRSNVLVHVWACLAAAGGRAVRQRLAAGPAWDMVCLELLDARDHAERVAPDARGVDVRLPEGEPLELVRRATALLELADPAEQTEQVLALRVRLRRVEHLLAPDPDPWHVA